MREIEYKFVTQRTNLGTALVALIVAFVGVGLLLWSNDQSLWVQKEVYQGLIRDLGSLCVVTVAFTLIWELTAKRAFVDELLTKARISHELNLSGIVQIAYDQQYIDWDQLFNGAREVDLYFAYARTWRGAHQRRIRELSSRDGINIRVIMPDPDDQLIMQGLAARFNLSPEIVRERILETSQDFLELRRQNQNKGAYIEIWYVSRPPIFALYRFDNIVILSLYSYENREASTGVPHFVAIKGGSLYNFAFTQLQTLIDPENVIGRKI